jgi:hypothetical protein
MRTAGVILADAVGSWCETLRVLGNKPLLSVLVVFALGALDEATVRLMVATLEILPPGTFSHPQYALLFQIAAFAVTLLLCAASITAAYFVVLGGRSIARGLDGAAALPRFGRWMRRAMWAWFGILAGAGLFSIAIQFLVMFVGIEVEERIDWLDWTSGCLYAVTQALLASYLLLHLPEPAGEARLERSAARFRRKSLFVGYLILFLISVLLITAAASMFGSLSTAASLRSYYAVTSLTVILSVLFSCSAARRFAARASATAPIFD